MQGNKRDDSAPQRWHLVLVDGVSILISVSASLAIRFGTMAITPYIQRIRLVILVLVLLRLSLFAIMGLYRPIPVPFRRRTVFSLIGAVTLSSLITAVLVLGLAFPLGLADWFPRSLLMIELLPGIILAGAIRVGQWLWDTKIGSRLEGKVQFAQRSIQSNESTLLIAGALGLLVCGRLFLQLMLYRSGFASVTADDFGRTVMAARWAQEPYVEWYGAWLPFHMYMVGAALRVKWDLLWVPRAFGILCGVVSVVLVYQLARMLFQSRRIGLLSAILLAVNPAHVWLSSTSLTDMPNTTLVLASMVTFALYLRRRARHYVYISAFILALANGFRFESWMMSTVFSSYLITQAILHLCRRDTDIRELLTLTVPALIPWVFPIAWVAGNYLATGDPLFSLAAIRLVNVAWHGGGRSYGRYLETFLRIDPYATVLGGVGLVACLFQYRKSQAVPWFVAMAVIPVCMFAFLHGGQVEPPGNYLRYLPLFMFVTYPAVAFLIDLVITVLSKSQLARSLTLALVVCGMTATQTRTTLEFVNDPAAQGLEVGQRIRALRKENPNLSWRPMLIEVSYWDYVAIHVGANDISLLMYDRQLDIRQESPSLLLSDVGAVRKCLALYNISYIVVKSPELDETIQTDLGIPPSEEVNVYAFYHVPGSLTEGEGAHQKSCPLVFGSGY
jgi:hypothetical protein